MRAVLFIVFILAFCVSADFVTMQLMNAAVWKRTLFGLFCSPTTTMLISVEFLPVFVLGFLII